MTILLTKDQADQRLVVQNRLSFLNEISFIDYIDHNNSETSAEIIKNLKT